VTNKGKYRPGINKKRREMDRAMNKNGGVGAQAQQLAVYPGRFVRNPAIDSPFGL
jgi:hypothetical protein